MEKAFKELFKNDKLRTEFPYTWKLIVHTLRLDPGKYDNIYFLFCLVLINLLVYRRIYYEFCVFDDLNMSMRRSYLSVVTTTLNGPAFENWLSNDC